MALAFHLVSGSFEIVLLLGLGRNQSLWMTGSLFGETMEKRVEWLFHMFS